MSSAITTLVPGYHHVEQFDDDDEYERDENGKIIEEVEYVTLDVGVVEPTLVPSTTAYRLIGLDTPTPYLQLSGTIFKGSHQELLGTELHFADARDESDQTKKSLVPFSTTEKRIRFREVELKPKKEEPLPGQTDVSQYEHTSVNAKKRKVQTVEQLVGNEPVESTPGAKGRRGRRKGKGKEKAQEVAVEGGAAASAEPVPQPEPNAQIPEASSQGGDEQMDTTEG